MQVALELRHGTTVHCDVALAALRKHLVLPAGSTLQTGTPARTYSELLSHVSAEAGSYKVENAANLPVCHAWHSQQVCCSFLNVSICYNSRVEPLLNVLLSIAGAECLACQPVPATALQNITHDTFYPMAEYFGRLRSPAARSCKPSREHSISMEKPSYARNRDIAQRQKYSFICEYIQK